MPTLYLMAEPNRDATIVASRGWTPEYQSEWTGMYSILHIESFTSLLAQYVGSQKLHAAEIKCGQ